MSKVIETNISIRDNEIIDFQSRVIEVKSWNDYVNEIGNAETVIRQSIIGNLNGNSIPRSSKIENFTYDEKTLKCDVYNYYGIHTKKLAYLAEENERIVFKNGSVINFVMRNENVTRGKVKGWFDKDSMAVENFKQEYQCKFVEESDI